MTAVLILSDDTFEDAFIVIGLTGDEVALKAVEYLRAARPMTPLGRLQPPDHPPLGGWQLWLNEILPDLEDIDIEIYSMQDGTAMPTLAFHEWIGHSAEHLYRAHTPHTVDVLNTL